MKKFLLYDLAFFIFGFLFFSQPPNASAQQCTIEVSPREIQPNFKGDIIIKSTNNCLSDKDYAVFIYPKTTTLDRHILDDDSPYTAYPAISAQSGTITVEFNDRVAPISKIPFGDWYVKVCDRTSMAVNNCISNEVGLLTTTIAVTAYVSATAPDQIISVGSNSPLPKIDFSVQEQCVFEAGKAATINRVADLDRNKSYVWWWYDAYPLPPTTIFTTKRDVQMLVEIPAKQTKIPGARIFCIADGGSYESLGPPDNCIDGVNGIWLKFINRKPTVSEFKCPLPDHEKHSYGGLGLPAAPACEAGYSIKGVNQYVCKTAVGTIDSNPAGLVNSIMRIVLGVSGGIAILLIMVSGFKFMGARGNPEKIQAAREQLISAIVGLSFIIFSLAILQIIGVDILKIPGFTK